MVASPPNGVLSPEEIVTGLSSPERKIGMIGRPVPVYGALSCDGSVAGCQPGVRGVWVILYPDWVGPGGDSGWVVVDAITGVEEGYVMHDPTE